jgi:hypothetical protein
MLLVAVGCLGLGIVGAERHSVIRVVVRDLLMLLAMLDIGSGLVRPIVWAALLVTVAMVTALAARRGVDARTDLSQSIGMILMAGLLLAPGTSVGAASHAGMSHDGALPMATVEGIVVFAVVTVAGFAQGRTETAGRWRSRLRAHSDRAHHVATALALGLMVVVVLS